MSATHYRTLGVSPDADEGTIRRAYLDLVRRHHPDQGGGSSAQLQGVNAAYEVLRDPGRRADYDRELGNLLQADFTPRMNERRVRGRLLGPLLVLVLAAGTMWLAQHLLQRPPSPPVTQTPAASDAKGDVAEPDLRPPS